LKKKKQNSNEDISGATQKQIQLFEENIVEGDVKS